MAISSLSYFLLSLFISANAFRNLLSGWATANFPNFSKSFIIFFPFPNALSLSIFKIEILPFVRSLTIETMPLTDGICFISLGILS
ncbi:MAG: hypothetical protein HQK51_21730 [Oligoflexia bacterium]|nr:hypothetical protein [Oligoflexia bacterium]